METPRTAIRSPRRSASFVGTVTLGGRVLERAAAFGQILLIAAFLGSTTRADLYFIASIVPLTFGSIIGEALYASVLPPLSRRADDDVSGLAAAGLWISAALLGMTTLAYLGVVAIVVPIAAPAGSDSLATWLAFAPLGVFVGLGAYLSAVLLRLEHYVWPPFRSAAAAIVGFGLSALALVLTDSVTWVAVAVSAGYAVAFALLVVELARATGRRLFELPARGDVHEALSLRWRFSTSLTGGLIGGQIFVFLERALAASLGPGAVAAISYARGVAFTPGIVAQSISLGLYPRMLRAEAARDIPTLRSSFLAGLRATLFVATITAVYLLLYSGSITRLLFGHGSLTATSLLEVSRTMAAFSLAAMGTMLMMVTSRAFAAADRFHGIVVSQSVALALYVPLALLLRPPLGPAGLAIAFGAAEVAGSSVGIALCARRVELRLSRIMRQALLPVLARAAPVALLLAAFRFGLDPRSNAVEAVGGAAIGALVSLAVLWWSGWPEIAGLRRFAHRLLRPGQARRHAS